MKKTALTLFILPIIFFYSIHSEAQRIGHSRESWKTIRTDHFNVIFSAEQQDLGRYYATIAEEAYAHLATVFTNPIDRITLIVNDTTDISNGYATVIPYPHIMAYSVPIGDHESLSEAGEWARELVTHELTHIMQLEPAHGVYKYIKPIFGNIVAPNLLLPLWWKEGMAVEMETQFSPQGRTRSKYQDATLRALVMDYKLFQYTLPQANEVLPSWPYGSRPYLFGSLIWSELNTEKGIKSTDYIVNRQAERFPYALETPMEELTEKRYESLYTQSLFSVQNNAQNQLKELQTKTPTELKEVKQQGQNSFSPSWSNAFNLLAYLEQVDGETEITVLNSQMQKIKLKRKPTGSLSNLEFHPTEKKLLYTKADLVDSKYKLSDIYIYNLANQKSEKITQSARAREAHFSEDGKKIVFISTFQGKTQVKWINLADRKITEIADSGYENRFQSPIFWSSEEVLVAKRNSLGQQTLLSINTQTREQKTVNLAFTDIRFLKKKGSLLYFTSSQNGVHNIYVSQDLQTAKPLTHVLTGLWSYDIDLNHQVVWATTMTSHGFHVTQSTLSAPQGALPKISNQLEKRYKFANTPRLNVTNETEDYSAGQYLWPSYWIPYIASSSSSKGIYVQAQTSGHDPLHIHEYTVIANYETDLQKGGFSGLYSNSAWALPFELGTRKFYQTFGNTKNIIDYQNSYVSVLPDVFFIHKKLNLELGLQFETTESSTQSTQHKGAFLQTSYIDYSQTLFQISPESGWGTLWRYENNQTVKNSENYDRLAVSALGYYSYGLPTHHVLTSRINGVHTFQTDLLSRFGSSNSTQFLGPDSLVPQFVLRGYLPSQFYGRKLWTLNTEYRFPIRTLEKGSGTDAYFLKRLTGAFVVDGLATEGNSMTEAETYEKRSLNETFWSSGFEIKLDTTLGYVLPMNFILGLYVPHSPKFSSSVQTGLSLQIGGF